MRHVNVKIGSSPDFWYQIRIWGTIAAPLNKRSFLFVPGDRPEISIKEKRENGR